MSYSQAFNHAVAHLLSLEGGYVDNPRDRGGKTKFGISQRAYPDLDITALTEEQAIALYHKDYWQPCRCPDLPYKLAAVLFDSAVNHGPVNAIKMLQQAVNVTPDGKFGSVTRLAANRYPVNDALVKLLSVRARHYCKIVLKRPDQIGFLHGWCKRLFLLHSYLLTSEMPK